MEGERRGGGRVVGGRAGHQEELAGRGLGGKRGLCDVQPRSSVDGSTVCRNAKGSVETPAKGGNCS